MFRDISLYTSGQIYVCVCLQFCSIGSNAVPIIDVLTSPCLALLLCHMADRAAKLRKLDDIRRRNPHVTASALESLMRDVSQHGLPELFNRKNMNEA